MQKEVVQMWTTSFTYLITPLMFTPIRVTFHTVLKIEDTLLAMFFSNP